MDDEHDSSHPPLCSRRGRAVGAALQADHATVRRPFVYKFQRGLFFSRYERRERENCVIQMRYSKHAGSAASSRRSAAPAEFATALDLDMAFFREESRHKVQCSKQKEEKVCVCGLAATLYNGLRIVCANTLCKESAAAICASEPLGTKRDRNRLSPRPMAVSRFVFRC